MLTAISGDARVYWYNQLETPWGLRLPPSEYAYFHVVERGDMCIKLKGERTVRPVSSGDLVILPHGGGHVIADSPASTPHSLEVFIRLATKRPLDGRSFTAARLVCGKFQFENPALNPLLPLLPAVIRISSKEGKTDEWLESTLRLLAYEARTERPGSREIISRLSGVIFIQAMRFWLQEQPEAQGGWFGALRDPQIAAALGAIHREPSQQWSVAGLAEAAAMSRSNFASRFNTLLGVPPLTYLNNWRLHLAAGLLKSGQLRVGEIAARVGYASETSFSKAFKRKFSIAPAFYRRSSAANGEGEI